MRSQGGNGHPHSFPLHAIPRLYGSGVGVGFAVGAALQTCATRTVALLLDVRIEIDVRNLVPLHDPLRICVDVDPAVDDQPELGKRDLNTG